MSSLAVGRLPDMAHPGRGDGKRLWTRNNPLAVAGFVLVSAVILVALAAPFLGLAGPNAIDALHRLEGPTLRHLFGTDDLGRDVFSRIAWGARWSLAAVGVATALIMSIGVSLGIIAGYYGGLVDEILMRIVDVFLALPSLLLALAIAGILGSGFGSVLFALIAVWWAGYARLVRGLVVGLRERDFIAGARALGGSNGHVMIQHVLPNVLPPVLILATIEMGDLILAVAALGFLGVGVHSPDPEWGTMVSDARPFFLSAPRLMVLPGLAIMLTVVAFNLIGDGLRDALDPGSNPIR